MVANWDTLAELYYNGGWQLLADACDSATGVRLERGVSDELDLKAGVCTFRLNDPTDLYRPSNAASSIYGQTGAWMRGAFATGSSVRFTGEATKMDPGETPDHQAVAGTTVRGNRWVDVELGGPLARVGAWREPLESPLFTQISKAYAATLKGYFPLEEGRDSTQLANVVAPSRPGRVTGAGATLGSDQTPGGAARTAQISASGGLQMPYAPMSPTAGWQMGFAAYCPNVDATLRDIFVWRTSNGYTWRWRASTGAYELVVEDSLGASVVAALVGTGTAAQPQWIFNRFKVRVSGGNVLIDYSWYAEDAGTFWGGSTSYAGTNMGAPTVGNVPGNATTNGAFYSHHFVVTTNADNLEATDFTRAFNGYRGERAADRFARLCSSRGLAYLINGTAALTAPMGPQPIATFQDQLKEIRATEGGLIFDRANTIGLVLATRQYLYDQAAAPVLELTYPTHVSGTVKETTGGADTFNVVTAENATGSSATATLTTGRYGTADPPAGSGRLDKAIRVNLDGDGGLAGVANWWLRFYTQPGPRFDAVTVDADLQPGLLAACNAAEPGTFMLLTGRTPDPLLLLILSTAQDTNRKRNRFTFRVAAGAIFDVAVLDDTATVIDSGSTTLAEDLTTTETAVDITTARLAEVWSQTGVPYAWNLAGERVTVTAMTAPAGTGPWTQTATVTRSVNGVVKTQTTGTSVQLADPKYIG
jgi:hypothetical protein